MKTNITSRTIALSLLLAAATPALAEHGEYRNYYGSARPYGYEHGHQHGYHRGYGWAAPAAVLAITGIAAGVAASAYYAPRPVYAAPAPPVYVAPPSAYWNYCPSVGQYYPYVRYCPDGWQLVPAR